jgi:hypothetical protein
MARTRSGASSSSSTRSPGTSRSSSARPSSARAGSARSSSRRSSATRARSRRSAQPKQLTALESKLGEVTGLAMAAQGATQRVAKLVDDAALRRQLEQMAQEARETELRCTQVAASINGKKGAIMKKARETKQEATKMMSTYLGRDADALDGFEFLTMAEAGEVGHWAIVDTMNKKAKVPGLQEVVRWAKPIQKRHFDQTLKGSLQLAAEEDPSGPA